MRGIRLINFARQRLFIKLLIMFNLDRVYHDSILCGAQNKYSVFELFNRLMKMLQTKQNFIKLKEIYHFD